MRKIRDVLRYRHTTDLSLDAIAGALRVSKGVVAKYLRLAAGAGLTWPLPDDLDDRALERRLYPRPPVVRASAQVEPDYARVHQELKKKGVTLTLLWQEYRAEAGAEAYQYTAFCTRYRAWAGTLKRSMRQVHRAGEKLFADYAGPTVPVIDASTGEVGRAQIFVAVLGASNYTYACATPGQTQARPRPTGSRASARPWPSSAASLPSSSRTTRAPSSPIPTAMSRSPAGGRPSSPPITARSSCRPGHGAPRTRPRSRSGCRSSNAGFWPGCAITASSAWPR